MPPSGERPRILLVEDNAALRAMLRDHLVERDMIVEAVGTGAAALVSATVTAADAMVLDLGLPDMDGLEVLRALPTLPTLVLTARGAVESRVSGLDAGADDYLVKPFDTDEFDARLRALLRRASRRADRPIAWRDLTYDPASRVASRGGERIDLTTREGVVLDLLIRRGERIVVRDALLDHLYRAEDEITANALEAVVSRLRRKLAGLGGCRIETIRGIGYRLSAG